MISRTLRTILREKAPVGSRLSILREGEVLGGGEKLLGGGTQLLGGEKIVEKGWRETFTEDCNTTQVRAQKQRLSRCLMERELQFGHQKWTFPFIFGWPAFFKFFHTLFPFSCA